MMIRALASVGLALNYSTHLLRNPGIYPPLFRGDFTPRS